MSNVSFHSEYGCAASAILAAVLVFGLVVAEVHAHSDDELLGLKLTKVEQSWLEQHKQITLAFDGFFPPYSFLNNDGQLEGFSVDLMKLVEQRIGISFEIHADYEWEAIYTDAQQRQVDVIATMVQKPDRLAWFMFSEPYVFKSLVVITRLEDESVTRREDIADKTVALVKGYQYEERILSQFPNVSPLRVDSMLDALNAVSTGEADAAITFLAAGHYYRNKYLLTNLKYAAIYDQHSSNESIAVRNDWPEMAAILNKALNSISEAEMQQLRSKWLPVDSLEALIEIELTEEEERWISEHRNIRLGVDPEFAPFEYLDQARYQGMASDYVRLLNRRLKLNMQVVDGLGWEDVIRGAQRGEIDVLPCIGKTDERQNYMSFTEPYLNFHRVIVTRDDMPFLAGIQELAGMRVAVQSSTSHHGFLREQSNLQPKVYKTLQESLLALSGGEVDAFVGNVASATYWIRELNLSNLKIAAPVSNEVQSLHFAVRKDWPELLAILQKGLDSISARQHKRISEKWLPLENKSQVDYRLMWQIVILFSALIAGVLLWNFLLNRKVQLKTSQLEYAANYDQLTGLPNRFLILDRMKQRMADSRLSKHKVALISINLDEFKKINETFGHSAGDSILQEFSCRLKAAVGDNAIPGRLGADQFLVIQNQVSDASEAAVLAERIIACTTAEFLTPNQPVSLTSSLGISLFPEDGDKAELLLKNADAATHHAKRHMRGSYVYYTNRLNFDASRRLELERQIQDALAREEMEVYYQPKVESMTRKIVSFEALLRWKNSQLGMVSPTEFIPIAEKNGLIEQIGFFVLSKALSTLAEWQERYSTSFSMAINLSPVQFRSDDFVSSIESTILNHGLDSKTIEFEITEGILLSDFPGVEDKLRKIEALGIALAMDDFGTGYSSLSYLRKYRFNTLKIDREFINDIASEESDRKLVAAIIATAHALDLMVVAEGVETEMQTSILVEQGCDILQGWLFSKALPKEKVNELLYRQSVDS